MKVVECYALKMVECFVLKMVECCALKMVQYFAVKKVEWLNGEKLMDKFVYKVANFSITKELKAHNSNPTFK